MQIDAIFSLTKYLPHIDTGWLVAALLFIYIFIKDLPEFAKLKASVLLPLSQWLKFKGLQKSAIKNDIEGTVNVAVKILENEMPEGTIKGIEIEYINDTKKEAFIREGRVFVRIKPAEKEEENFVVVTKLYLDCVLLPNSKKLLTEEQSKAVTYFTAYRIMGKRARYLNKLHDDYYKPDTDSKPKIKEYFEAIECVDKRGLFYSTMLRSIEECAGNVRFTSGSLNTEFDNILQHLQRFVEELKKKTKDGNDNLWNYKSSGVSFALLLVADPLKARIGSYKAYLNRLKKNFSRVSYVFVVFSKKEWLPFGKEVADALDSYIGATFIGEVESSHDYRGKNGGIVRLYERKIDPSNQQATE